MALMISLSSLSMYGVFWVGIYLLFAFRVDFYIMALFQIRLLALYSVHSIIGAFPIDLELDLIQ